MIPETKPKMTLRAYAKKYGCSHSLLQILKREGFDLDNEELIKARLESKLVKPNLDYSVLLEAKQNTNSGLRAVIQRLRDAELNAHKDYIKSLKNNTVNAPACLKIWTSIVNELRKIESEVPTIENDNKESISLQELNETIGELFRNLRLDLDALPRKLANVTEGLDKIQRERAAEKEVNRIIDSLYQCIYLKN